MQMRGPGALRQMQREATKAKALAPLQRPDGPPSRQVQRRRMRRVAKSMQATARRNRIDAELAVWRCAYPSAPPKRVKPKREPRPDKFMHSMARGMKALREAIERRPSPTLSPLPETVG